MWITKWLILKTGIDVLKAALKAVSLMIINQSTYIINYLRSIG